MAYPNDYFTSSMNGAPNVIGPAAMHAVPIHVHRGYLLAKRNRGLIATHCYRDAEDAFANAGQTVQIVKASWPTQTYDLVDGAAIVNDDTYEVGVNLTLDHYRTTTIGKTQIAQTIANSVAWAATIAGRMARLANDIEADIVAIAQIGFLNVAGTPGVALNAGTLADARYELAEDRTPLPEISGHLAPRAYRQALNSVILTSNFILGTGASPVSTGGHQGSQAVLDGYGHPYFENNAIGDTSWGTATATYNLLFHPMALCFASRKVAPPMFQHGGVSMEYVNVDGLQFSITYQWQPTYLAEQIVIGCLYGAAVGRGEWGCVVRAQ